MTEPKPKKDYVRHNPKPPRPTSAIFEAMSGRKQAEKVAALSEKQKLFAKFVAQEGLNPTAAYRMAGFSAAGANSNAAQMMKDPRIQALINVERESWRQADTITKKEVLEGIKEGIEVGKLKADGLTMIAGWREIAKIMGYYAPTNVKVEHNHRGEVLVKQIQSMSDEDLMASLNGPQGAVLDAEFKALGHEEIIDIEPEAESQMTETHDNGLQSALSQAAQELIDDASTDEIGE